MSNRIYLDHNATAPLWPEVCRVMADALETYGNPSSVHAEGRQARALIEAARVDVARLVGAEPGDVVFTSGGTEANNMVIGAGWHAILTDGAEHDCILAPARACGAALREVAVTGDGLIDLNALEREIAALGADAGETLVAVQAANNETGAIQPLALIAELARDAGVAVHSDAVQAVGKIPVDFAVLDIDSLALSAHKIGGPKGVGALILSEGARMRPVVLGGGQERGRRSGTENVLGIAGFGVAARQALAALDDFARLARLRDRLESALSRIVPSAVFLSGNAPRLPNTSCMALPGRQAETLVIALDLAGIAVSSGAACSSGKVARSHVLAAMGVDEDVATGAIRVSLGWATTEADIDAFLAAFRDIAGRSGGGQEKAQSAA